MDAAVRDAAGGLASNLGGILEVGGEDGGEHVAGALVGPGDLGVVVEVGVEERAQLARLPRPRIAVADEQPRVPSHVVGRARAAGRDARGAGFEGVADEVVGQNAREAQPRRAGVEAFEVEPVGVGHEGADFHFFEGGRFDEPGFDAVL